MKRFFVGLASALAALCMIQTPALAQAAIDGKVSIPWGDILSSTSTVITTLALSALAFALTKLPASVAAMIKTWQVDQLLEKSISYGINMVAGAAKGQSLTVPVGNAVLEQALEYAIANGSKALVDWMGGHAAVEQKLIARMDFVPEAGNPPK